MLTQSEIETNNLAYRFDEKHIFAPSVFPPPLIPTQHPQLNLASHSRPSSNVELFMYRS